MLSAVRILLALRDKARIRPLIAKMDDGERCIFDLVTTGTQALAACRKAPPDILVIDAVLPEMDGLAVTDQLRCELGERMPRMIGVSRTPFSRLGFLRRGASAVIAASYDLQELREAIEAEINDVAAHVDWMRLHESKLQAGMLLNQMGMHASLKGYAYLCSAAALACENEARLFAIGKGIYEPIAAHHNTSKENVERLIRHAVESTMSAAQARGVYSLFGNTIDPAKGKPTNAQVIAMLVKRMWEKKQGI